MQVADHFSAVKRRFESRAMPAYEKPPAKLVDIYLENEWHTFYMKWYENYSYFVHYMKKTTKI